MQKTASVSSKVKSFFGKLKKSPEQNMSCFINCKFNSAYLLL